MKKLKKVTLLLCSIIAGILFTACGDNPREDLLNYLENKYPDDNFSWYLNELGSEGKNPKDYEILVHSDKYPDAEIHASRIMIDGKLVYNDNYMGYYMEEKVSKYINDISKPLFGQCKVFCKPSKLMKMSNSITIQSTAEEFLSSNPWYHIYICISPEPEKKIDIYKIEEIKKIMLERQWQNCTINILLYDSIEYLKSIDSYDDIKIDDVIDYCLIELSFDGKDFYVIWKEK